MYLVFGSELEQKVAAHVVLLDEARQIPTKKQGWSFSWKNKFKEENCRVYALLTVGGSEIQGMLALKLVEANNPKQCHYKMDLVELAPHNYGSEGKYKRVAGCLMAFACSRAFELENNYKGWLSFVAKTKIANMYIENYGAKLLVSSNPPILCFDGVASTNLIKEYLLGEEL